MGEWEVLVGHADPAAGAGATARWNPESGTLRPNANNVSATHTRVGQRMQCTVCA